MMTKQNLYWILEFKPNQDKSAAKFCRQLAARVQVMFWNFYLLKSHKIANNASTTESRKNKHSSGILKNFLMCFD